MKKLSVGLMCLCCVFLLAAAAGAQEVLYGLDNQLPSNLYTVDPATGATTLVGPTGIDQATGLAVKPGTNEWFASPGGGGSGPQPYSGCIFGIDVTTGASMLEGCDPAQGGLDPLPGTSFSPDGTLYATRLAANAAPNDSMIYLATVDPTSGMMTDVGLPVSPWCTGHALTFVRSDLYMTSGCGPELVHLDPSTAAIIGATPLNLVGFPMMDPRFGTMTTSKDGVVYGAVKDRIGGGVYLGTLDVLTGDYTYIADLPNNIQVLEFAKPYTAISPASGEIATSQGFDLTMLVHTFGRSLKSGTITVNNKNITSIISTCTFGSFAGGVSVRCPDILGSNVPPGVNTVAVSVRFKDGTTIDSSAEWTIVPTNE